MVLLYRYQLNSNPVELVDSNSLISRCHRLITGVLNTPLTQCNRLCVLHR